MLFLAISKSWWNEACTQYTEARNTVAIFLFLHFWPNSTHRGSNSAMPRTIQNFSTKITVSWTDRRACASETKLSVILEERRAALESSKSNWCGGFALNTTITSAKDWKCVKSWSQQPCNVGRESWWWPSVLQLELILNYRTQPLWRMTRGVPKLPTPEEQVQSDPQLWLLSHSAWRPF